MAKDPYRYFRIEARELLDEMSSATLALDQGSFEPDVVAQLMRLAHTLKGAARVVGQAEIGDHAHAIEDLLGPLRDEGGGPAPKEVVDAVLSRLDEAVVLLDRLGPVASPQGLADQGAAGATHPALAATASTSASASTPRSATGPAPASEGTQRGAADAKTPPQETLDLPWLAMRSNAEEIDGVLSGVTESQMHLGLVKRQLQGLRRGHEMAERLLDALATDRRGHGHHAQPALHGLASLTLRQAADDLHALLGRLEGDLSRACTLLDRELRDVRDTAEQLQLVAARCLFTGLQRTARDVAQAQGKRVNVVFEGVDVRLHGEVLAAVQPALVQILRNAVAHGIEPADVRLQAGKPDHGQIKVNVHREGGRVVFTCTDDGAGIDLEEVARRARERGLLATDAAPDPDVLIALLLKGGLSTAHAVTGVSGRGVGLNVVDEAVRRLGARLSVQTARGQGTSVAMSVPVSLAAMAVLEVQADGVHAAIPLEAVKRIRRVASEGISGSAEGQAVIDEGAVVPFVALQRLLRGAAPPESSRRWTVVLIGTSDGGMVALGVERLLGLANVVLRPLPDLAPASALIAGAIMDEEGQPRLVLEPDELLRSARQGAPGVVAAGPALAAKPNVLVVDDSLTTRMLEQSILESAGYDVQTAASAEEGLSKARQTSFALYLVDVDMPGMDGFEFVRTTRADPLLGQVPAILVTSRASPEDRRRGMEAGASAYIVKGDFAQAAFLDTVRRLANAPQAVALA